MTFSFASKHFVGVMALLSFGATLAVAQDPSRTRPRSDRRLPISKEATGEVLIMRTDTAVIYRTDTVQLTHRDTVRIIHTRVDTVVPRLPTYRYPAGFYAGLAGGFSTPTGSIYAPNSTGGTAQLQVGWTNAKQVFGGRFDWNGAWPGQDSRFGLFHSQASIQNFSLSARVQYPFHFGGETATAKTDPCDPPTTYSRGPIHRFAVYAIGGYTYTNFRNLPMVVDIRDLGDFDDFNNLAVIDRGQVAVVDADNRAVFLNRGLAFFVPGSDDWHSDGGWNVGGGLSMFWGRSELFVEARVMGFKPSFASTARQVPVVFGLNFY